MQWCGSCKQLPILGEISLGDGQTLQERSSPAFLPVFPPTFYLPILLTYLLLIVVTGEAAILTNEEEGDFFIFLVSLNHSEAANQEEGCAAKV